MKERGILFNGDMVRAILDGRKTQTRRPIKKQPPRWTWNIHKWDDDCIDIREDDNHFWVKTPFGAPGDRLWVRETWAEAFEINRTFYRADADDDGTIPYLLNGAGGLGGGVGNATVDKWRPSIHMPRWASRITLEVERVWAERVQEISEANAWAEGCPEERIPNGLPSSVAWFYEQWNSIYAAKGFGWNTNCWVFGCEFKVLEIAK